MFQGKNKAIIAGKDREIELITEQRDEAKKEVIHLREQLDRVYASVLGLNTEAKLKRPDQGDNRNALGR